MKNVYPFPMILVKGNSKGEVKHKVKDNSKGYVQWNLLNRGNVKSNSRSVFWLQLTLVIFRSNCSSQNLRMTVNTEPQNVRRVLTVILQAWNGVVWKQREKQIAPGQWGDQQRLHDGWRDVCQDIPLSYLVASCATMIL